MAEELARRRKGKEVQNLSLDGPSGGVGRVKPRIGGDLVGPSVGGGFIGPRVGGLLGLRDGGGHVGPRVGGSRVGPNPSRSDSCDPLECRVNLNARPISSDDADLGIGPVAREGMVKEKPIIISGGTDEDMELGGEGGGEKDVGCLRVPKLEKYGQEVVVSEDGRGQQTEGMKMMATGGGTGVGYVGGRSQEASKGSSASVPPGFQWLKGPKSKAATGVSSPFGKLQRGGFKFLKRSASSTFSGVKSAQAQAKKTRPLSSLPDHEITEVASNVGIVKQLSEQQIARLKAREKDQASS